MAIAVTGVRPGTFNVIVEIGTPDHPADVEAQSIQDGAGLSVGVHVLSSDAGDGSCAVSKLRDKNNQDH